MRFLARVWPARDEVSDLRQEAYTRVYEAAMTSRPFQAKAFLFSTARHLMADRVRRERIVSIQAAGESDFLNVLVDEQSPEQWMSTRQDLARLAHAFDRLPSKCREVVWLRRVQELPQREVAQRLGLAEKTVEKHVSNGGRLLAQYMRQLHSDASIARVADAINDENGHEQHSQD